MSLRELAKTCKFCNKTCLEKNIRDQIIEGLQDPDIIETLLQEKDSQLSTAISKCQAQEAVRKQRVEMTSLSHASETVQSLSNAHRNSSMTVPVCQGCGPSQHPGCRKQCPAYNQTCLCQKTGHFASVCHERQAHQANPPKESRTRVRMSNMKVAAIISLAPSVTISLTSLNRSTVVEALPDSGADISAAGIHLLTQLGEHQLNLLPSQVTPRAVNGMSMQPIGKIPVTLQLGPIKHKEDLHIYQEVSGVLLSWTASKALGILPECYPTPSM